MLNVVVSALRKPLGIRPLSIDFKPVDTASMVQSIYHSPRRKIESRPALAGKLWFEEKDPSKIVAILDTNNLDAIIAWAALADAGMVSTSFIHYDRANRLIPRPNAIAYIVLGAELQPEDLEVLTKEEKDTAVISYYGNYKYLHERQYRDMVTKILMVYPFGESEKEEAIEQEVSDNSICKTLLFWLPELVNDMHISTSWTMYFDDVARYTNGLTSRQAAVFEGKCTQARIHGLKQHLSNVTTGTITERRDLQRPVRFDQDAYLAQFRAIREDIRQTASYQIYGVGQPRLSIKTMNVPGSKFQDYLMAAQISEDAFIGYQDVSNSRIWRVYCKDRNYALVVERSLKPAAVWTEGAVICMQTHKPSFTP